MEGVKIVFLKVLKLFYFLFDNCSQSIYNTPYMIKTLMRSSRLLIPIRELPGGARQQVKKLNSPWSFLSENIVNIEIIENI